MDILTDTCPISRLEIVDTGRRRRWPDEAKVRIVEESLSGPRLASATARRHGISNQLLFSWRKAYRAGRLGAPLGFVPAQLRSEADRTYARNSVGAGLGSTVAAGDGDVRRVCLE